MRTPLRAWRMSVTALNCETISLPRPADSTTEIEPVVPDRRWLRQEDILPRHLIEKVELGIVGTGAVGAQAARTLAVMGVPILHIWDHDTVDEVNLGAQGWEQADVGFSKVSCLKQHLRALNPQVDVRPRERRFVAGERVPPIVLACTDSMGSRQDVYQSAMKHKAELFLDSRMGPMTFQIIAIPNPTSMEQYEPYLFTDQEAFQPSCTARTLYFCATVAGAMLASYVCQWVRGERHFKGRWTMDINGLETWSG